MQNLIVLLMLAGCVAALADAQTGRTQKAGAKASLTGCVDEHDGQYVLTNDTSLQPTARLLPSAGSAEDNFAKHMGHKVTVRGKLSKEDPLPVMTVDGIETISETCAPSSGRPQQ